MFRPRALAGLIALVFASPSMGQGRGAAGPVELTFLNAPEGNAPLREVPWLAVGVGDALRAGVVDTGSTGVVLSATAIPDVKSLPDRGAGELTYSSSGRIMRGRWVLAPVTIAGRSRRIVTRPMPVLAVDAIACTPHARRCTPEAQPRHVAMLGIGFGRRHDHQPAATPDHNPLWNVALPAGLPHAYRITRHGLTLGAGAEGFTLIPLVRDASGTDWRTPPACVTLNDGRPACGTVLVDTGITSMFLTLPADRLPGGDSALPEGTGIRIDLTPGRSEGPLGYGFRTGDAADPVTPSAITLSGIGRRPTFVNTGVHLLNRFDYRYDADVGTVGYRPDEARR